MRREAPKSFATVADWMHAGWVAAALLTSLLALGATAGAKEKPKAKTPPASGASKPSGSLSEPLNACGCYKNGAGACVCTDKKAKCDCPGECEPVGCGEKREKELDREMAAEVKRAQQQDADEKKRKAAEEAAEKGEPAPDAGTSAAAPDEATPPAPSKKAPPKAPKPTAKKS